MWWPGLWENVKRYVTDCYPCSVSISRNDTPLVTSRPLPEGPWKEVSVYFKGPVGGQNGFYYHVVIDNYSHYPEVSIVPDTKFSTLKPVLEEI